MSSEGKRVRSDPRILMQLLIVIDETEKPTRQYLINRFQLSPTSLTRYIRYARNHFGVVINVKYPEGFYSIGSWGAFETGQVVKELYLSSVSL